LHAAERRADISGFNLAEQTDGTLGFLGYICQGPPLLLAKRSYLFTEALRVD
jgi:hypothetical protein